MSIKKLTTKKSIFAIISVVLCLTALSVALLGFVLPKHITVLDGEKEIKVATMAETVEEVLSEKNILLKEGDLVAPPLKSKIDDNGKIIITRSKEISLTVDGAKSTIYSRLNTVAEALDEANIILGEFDTVTPSSDALLFDGMTIDVLVAKKVSVTVDGKTHERFTTKPNVKAFLDDVMIYLEQYDEITPYLETPISDGLEILISRVTVENVAVEEKIPRTVINKSSSAHTKGQSVVSQTGADGKAKNTYKVIKRNGKIVSKTLVDSVVIKAPVDKIVLKGTKAAVQTQTVQQPQTLSSRGDLRYKKVLTCNASAYEPGVQSNGKWAGTTATGRKAGPGIVAVDPNVIPLNSRLYIESTDDGKSWTYGYAIAGDTGGAIKGNRIDLCFNTVEECYQFGRRQCKVYILE